MGFYCFVKKELNNKKKIKLKDLKERNLSLNGNIICNNCTRNISDEDYVKIFEGEEIIHEVCPS